MSYMEGILTFSEKSGKYSDMINTIPKCLHSLITTVSIPNKRGQGLRSNLFYNIQEDLERIRAIDPSKLFVDTLTLKVI